MCQFCEMRKEIISPLMEHSTEMRLNDEDKGFIEAVIDSLQRVLDTADEAPLLSSTVALEVIKDSLDHRVETIFDRVMEDNRDAVKESMEILRDKVEEIVEDENIQFFNPELN